MESKTSILASAHPDALQQLKQWIILQLQNKHVPRLADVWQYAQQHIRPKLSKKQVSLLLRLNKKFLQVMPQQRNPNRSRKYRPIVTSALGYMHGDIGFFPLSSHYSTPPTYRAGFLVLVDILSRSVYLEALLKNRKGPAIIRALEKIFQRHRKAHNYPILGISFDKEKSILSKQVQSFLQKNHIKFNAFSFTSSKAKFAENTIARVRKKMQVLEEYYNYEKPWWKLLTDVEIMFNTKPVMINGSLLPYSPSSITNDNVADYLASIQLKSPAHYFSQFNLDPELVQFKFQIGDYVKAKTIITSSALLGNKRSTHQLTPETFVVIFKKPYITRAATLGIAYLCKDVESESVQEFNEEDLALAEPLWG